MAMPFEREVELSEPAKKRRRTTKPKESIYVKPDPTPYTPAIRPLKTVRHATNGTIDVDGSETIESGERNENGAESSRMAIERAEANDEKYRARALKAWETKRRRQQERFDALGSSSWPRPLANGELHEPIANSFSADPFLAHLYVPDDVPKDDLLQSINAYASRHYTVNDILLAPQRRKRWIPHDNGQHTRQAQSRVPTPIPSKTGTRGDLDLEDSGSEFAPETQGSCGANNETEVPETLETRRKRGGQRGKRKLRDMYLALDGPALIAFGTLVQELVIAGLRQEGYVPVDALDEDSEGDFDVSDDETEPENESEGQ